MSHLNFDDSECVRLELIFLDSVFVRNTKREARLLLGNANRRYAWFCREYPELLEKLPRYQIVSFLGVSPVTLSRLKRKSEL